MPDYANSSYKPRTSEIWVQFYELWYFCHNFNTAQEVTMPND